MSEKNILIDESLTSFFYKNLDKVNRNSVCPLPQEFILYSSQVLNKFAFTENLNDKILGFEFLEAQAKPANERKIIYKDVGDTILVQLGIFPKLVSKKSVNKNYYIHIGKSAYYQMEALDCSFYDIPNFFHLLSTSLEYIIDLLLAMREATKFETFEQYLIQSNNETNQSLFLTPGKIKVS